MVDLLVVTTPDTPTGGFEVALLHPSLAVCPRAVFMCACAPVSDFVCVCIGMYDRPAPPFLCEFSATFADCCSLFRLLFFFFRGDLKQALKCYARTRDYCTTNRHTAEMCLHVIEVWKEMPDLFSFQ